MAVSGKAAVQEGLVKAVIWLAKWYVGTGIYERVSEEARKLIFTKMTGEEKMASLKAFIANEGIMIHKIVRDLIVSITRFRFEL